jgi:hypothetical protein
VEARRIEEGHGAHKNPYPVTLGPEFSSYLRQHAEAFLRGFYVELSDGRGKPEVRYWGDKYPHYSSVLPRMPVAFPTAVYVMIHRDLADVAVSVARAQELPAGRAAEVVGKIYAAHVTGLATALDRGAISEGSVIHVSFDALVKEPVEAVRRVYDALGLQAFDGFRDRITDLGSTHAHSTRKEGGQARPFEAQSRVSGQPTARLSEADRLSVESPLASYRDQIALGPRWVGFG